MKNRNLLFSLFFLGFAFTAVSQTQPVKKTDVNKDIDVLVVYEQVVEDGYGTVQIYKDLANGHYFKSNYIAAKKWYEKLFELEKTTDETLKFRYKQTLRALNLNGK